MTSLICWIQARASWNWLATETTWVIGAKNEGAKTWNAIRSPSDRSPSSTR